MACMKLGSKNDAFQRRGQAWFCTTGLPSDIVVEVGEMSFHLHKFPLLSRSGLIEKLIAKASVEGGEETCVIKIPDIPGGAKTFELVVKFCYGVKLELTSSNVVYLRCIAHNLEMTDEYGEGNLISLTENFLNEVVLKNWKDSLKALQTCDGLADAKDLEITKRCIESLSLMAVNESNLFGWPVKEQSGPLQSPGGSVLWNGINTGARAKHSSSGWWYEDASSLSLTLYKRLVSSMESSGIKQEILADSLTFYARRYLPGLKTRNCSSESGNLMNTISESEQKFLLEEIEQLLPVQKGLISTKFLFGLIRTAKILRVNTSCILNLEKRIGLELDQASLEDLLLPNFCDSKETLYDVDCVQRILERFLETDQVTGNGNASSARSVDDDDDDDDQRMGSPSLMPVTMVAKLIDGYLAEVAPDINLKLPEFLSLAGALPEYARPLDDGLYRAVDIYLKLAFDLLNFLSSSNMRTEAKTDFVSHPWLIESEREQVCRIFDCQKLSLEACTHAAQNERLPLRVIVQVLFFEQLQLKTSIAGCFLLSDNLDGSRQLRSGLVGPNELEWATTVRENQLLKVGMDSMRTRVSELEKECSNMKREIEKLVRGKTSDTWDSIYKKLGFKMKTQICSGEEGPVKNQKIKNGKADKAQDEKVIIKHKKKQYFQD